MQRPLLLALILQSASTALAQQTPPTSGADIATATATTQSVKTFDGQFFARFQPVTALDIIIQLPGFVFDEGASLRGFGGTAGNVLIDGRRPSSKTSLSDELGRIAARDVARVELISAASAGDVDVKGYTELANIVLKPASAIATTSTVGVGLQYQEDARLNARLAGTRAWKSQDWGARLNLTLQQSSQRTETAVDVHDQTGALTQTRAEIVLPNLVEFSTNGSISWTPTSGDSLNINGRLMGRNYNQQTGSIVRNALNRPIAVITDDYTDRDVFYGDLGGDWEHRLSPTSSVKLISVNSFVNWRPNELFEQFSPAGSRQIGTLITAEGKRGEHVGRAVWTFQPAADHTVEIAGEGAFNYRDFRRGVSTAAGAGPFVSQALPVASTRVEEWRGEVGASDTWRMTPSLTLEVGLAVEASTIAQSGDATQEREFTYPKPRAVANWAVSKNDHLRLSVERSVGQLDFAEFASVVSLVDNQLTVGNPDLRPQQTWATALEWKRRLGERGSLSLTAFYDRIDDAQDFVVIETAANTFFTEAGNIGDGQRWGLRVETTLPTDAVGVQGGQLKFTGLAQEAEVTDPISGRSRRIANEAAFDANLAFRQDLPALKLAWGFDYSVHGDSDSYRFGEIQYRFYGTGDLDVFVETSAFGGTTLRFEIENIGDEPQWLERRYYSPSRLVAADPTSIEKRTTQAGYRATLSARATF